MTDRHRQVKYEQLPDTQTDTETATETETERESDAGQGQGDKPKPKPSWDQKDRPCMQTGPMCKKRRSRKTKNKKKSEKNYCVCDHEGCGLLTRRRWSARAWNVVVSQQQRRRRWRCRWRWKRRRKWSREAEEQGAGKKG